MPSQVTAATAAAASRSSNSNSVARTTVSLLGSGSALYASPTQAPVAQHKTLSNNQDDHDDHSLRLQQSIEKQTELVAAATAKAFANRSVASTAPSSSTSSAHFSVSSFNMSAATAVDGINPYVEQQDSGDELDDDDADDHTDGTDDRADNSVYNESNQSLDEWENPSYLVKNLDTGESYNVEEIDQHYNLVTLDAVAAQHESTYVASGSHH